MVENVPGSQDALAALRIPAERKRRGRRRLRWLRYLTLALLVSAAAAVLLLRGRWDPVEVEVAVAQRLDPGAPRPVLTAGGYVIPHRKVELAPKISGRVEWIGVEKGDRVQQGQVLLRIEQGEFRAAVERAEALRSAAQARLRELEAGSRPEEVERARAQLEEARSNVVNAELDLKRFQQLHVEGAIARQALDAAQNRYEVALAQRAAAERNFELVRIGPRREQIDLARAQVREAEATLRAALIDLDNTQIRAPLTGTILERLVEPGEIVTTSFIGGRGAKSAVLSMANLGVLDVEIDVSQGELGKIRLDQHASVVLDAFPERTYRASVSEMAPEANRQKATLQVKVRIANPDEIIRPEMNAKVTFLEPGQTDAGAQPKVVVPREALLSKDGQRLVYVANGSKAAARPVSMGSEVDGRVEILQGLQGGESVIVRGAELLREGQRIRVKR